MEWRTDILGEEFQACVFEARGNDGVVRTATLVRHAPSNAATANARTANTAQANAEQPHAARTARRAVLFLHGWSDYFFNVELARFWAGHGFDFFALDMHNHGRSLQPDLPGGYVSSLEDYDAEIGRAIEIIASLAPDLPVGPLTLMGHSTGGLVAALWVSRHPGTVQQLVLNSPWLEMHGSSLVRRATWTMVEPLARLRPEAVIRLPERGFYWRSISNAAEGEWTLDDRFRPPMAFPVRAGWLSAVLAGHARVARGLRIDVPILVLLSGASANGPFWREEMRRSDAVLDVNTIAARALSLGHSVTLERVDGALHDVFLSPAKIRADAYARLWRWIRGYVLDEEEAGASREEPSTEEGDAGAASTAPP